MMHNDCMQYRSIERGGCRSVVLKCRHMTSIDGAYDGQSLCGILVQGGKIDGSR